MKTNILTLFLTVLTFAGCSEPRRLAPAPETIFNDHDLQVVTSFHNDRTRTISVLYGNDDAVANAGKERAGHVAGEVYKLVTWNLKGNPLWFGGNINGSLVSEETVTVVPGRDGSPQAGYTLELRGGNNRENAAGQKAERISFIFAQQASVFP
ncbi:hypothetical protein LZD49_29825 [Dyadobacter sp. CY261]|uniref:hypothetical protein n=1 Tax=Dyadobacter sp. CY261 TaxID=2907203 RepID=UPI001F191E31|nr:hypothetical protein [Dyadobacter sp. CY261]MCF0074722.1 hypothetical protein [Dyadobacter sp. CY261]